MTNPGAGFWILFHGDRKKKKRERIPRTRPLEKWVLGTITHQYLSGVFLKAVRRNLNTARELDLNAQNQVEVSIIRLFDTLSSRLALSNGSTPPPLKAVFVHIVFAHVVGGISL